MSEATKYGIRKCRDHWHVTDAASGEPLATAPDKLTREQALDEADRMNAAPTPSDVNRRIDAARLVRPAGAPETMSETAKCPGCGGDLYHYAACVEGVHGSPVERPRPSTPEPAVSETEHDLVYTLRAAKPRIDRDQHSLDVKVYKRGKYYGYINIHTHITKDESLSVGVTVRYPTKRRP